MGSPPSQPELPYPGGEPEGLDAPARLEALRACELLDAPPGAAFDRLTRLALRLLNVPMALVTLVDERRQFFVSSLGLPSPWAERRETPLTHSVCKFVVGMGRPLVVRDARIDPLLQDSPAIRELGIVAYAGVPLTAPGGETLGALAATDITPRDWTEDDLRVLRDLADAAVAEIGWRTEARQRRLVEEALRASDDRLRMLLEQAPVGIAILRGEALIYANATIRRMLGYESLEAIQGTPFVHFLAEEFREVVAEWVRQRASGAPVPTVSEGMAVRRDGATFPYRADTVVVDLPDGPAVVAFVADLTSQRGLEEQLRQAHKMEAIGRLAGGIAHDFNNLLMGILTPAELALSQLAPNAPARAELQEIMQAAIRAAALVRQLLAFSRKQAPRPTVLDLGTLVRNAEFLLRRTIGEHIRLEIRLDPGSLPLLANRGQLEQVLLNLVVNAREAMEHGGTLTIATENAGDDVALIVRDTGTGMDQETLSHIFEPFFTTKGVGRGTGLGLATVYGIVSRAGGDIAVESAPGRGSTFRVSFPRYAGPPEGPEGDAPGATEELGPRGSGTVLLVEDEEAVRRPISRMLDRLGYTVMTAPDGPAALAMFEADLERFDLVISDVVMPGMGGRALLERLRALRPDVKALLISGYDATAAGGEPADPNTAFLNKPFTGQELALKVRELLSVDPT